MGGVWNGKAAVEKCGGSSKKLKIQLPCDPAITLPGIFPKDHQSESQKDTCTPMLRAARFAIVKRQRQPQGPWTDEWINNVWILFSLQRDRDSDTCSKVDEPSGHNESKICQSQKDKYELNGPTYMRPRIVKFIETESRRVLARNGWRVGSWQL